MKFLHDIKLAYNADTDDKTGKEVSFFVFPTLEICRKRGVPTKIKITVSTLLFRDIVNEELVVTIEMLRDFLKHSKSGKSLKKGSRNVYHTFIETLALFAQKKYTFDLKDFQSYPKTKQKRDNFYLSFYIVLLFFFKQDYFAEFSYNGKAFNLSENEFVIRLGLRSEEKKISLFKIK